MALFLNAKIKAIFKALKKDAERDFGIKIGNFIIRNSFDGNKKIINRFDIRKRKHKNSRSEAVSLGEASGRLKNKITDNSEEPILLINIDGGIEGKLVHTENGWTFE